MWNIFDLNSLCTPTFFKEGNKENSVLTSMKMEYNILTSPKNENEIIDLDNVIAVQDANDKENIIIHPKYMQEKGTMCSTELWKIRDKKQFLRDMNGVVKTIEHKLTGEGLYRPQKFKKISLLKDKLKHENSIDEYSLFKNNITEIQKLIIKEKKVQMEKANGSDNEVNQSDMSKNYKVARIYKESGNENNSKGI